MNYLKVLYNVLAKVVPLYMAMILAYGSVKWWKLFTPDQCSGINKFVSLFVVPFFSFHFISINNPYTMNFHFILADSLQKLLILLILFVSSRISSRVSLECSITVFSLSTLPNTLAVGIPLLQGMYGDFSVSLMVQIVMLQCLVWYTLLLILFEFRAAKIMISHKFPDSADLISAVDVHSDVISLDEKDECLETEIQVREDGKLHVRLWKSSSSSYPVYPAYRTLWTRFGEGRMAVTHKHKGEILRKSASVKSDYFSKNYSNFGDCSNDAIDRNVSGVGTFRSKSLNMVQCGRSGGGSGGGSDGGYRSRDKIFSPVMGPTLARMREEEDEEKINPKDDNYYEINGLNHAQKPCGEKQEIEGPKLLKFFSRSRKVQPEIAIQCEPEPNIDPKPDPEPEPEPKPKPESVPKPTSLPPARVMTKLILTMVRRKLIRNPNTYSSFIGLAWSLISFKWNVTMPAIVANSVKIMSDTGLGMAMFSLGLFMASQPRIIAGGKAMAAYGAAVKFIVGPAVTAATAVAVGLRGNLLRITIVQASLPLGILPFVYAKEYDVHPDILSTAVIFGLLIALPITLVYFILLGLIK